MAAEGRGSHRSAAGHAEAAVRAYLDRIAAREAEIHAWAWLEPDRALAAAHAAAAASPGLPLLGRVIGVKDVIDTADMPTAYGSPIYESHRPVWDAACVAALRAAGAIILGKTATTEFAAIHPARTVNPHDPARTPGGSSSGSAAAVADGMVWAALGTQTAGSVIRPGAFCGVVGYKPTFGTVNRAGLKPLSEFTDTIGVLARTVADAASVIAAAGGRPDLSRLGAPPARPRIALCRTPYWEQAETPAREALAAAAERFRAAGAVVVDCELPAACAGLADAGMRILVREARQALAHELRTDPQRVSAGLRELLEQGDPDDPAPYDAARRLAAECRMLVERAVFSACDAILTPSTPGEAPVGLASTGSPVFNHLWSVLHVPCVNLPGLLGPAGMPVGVQLVGSRGGDAALLAVAEWGERALSAAD
jgi:Asp-tRNA(Asn)/Glu-tRNA(Gln) amidotransferase A subunit family amidase